MKSHPPVARHGWPAEWAWTGVALRKPPTTTTKRNRRSGRGRPGGRDPNPRRAARPYLLNVEHDLAGGAALVDQLQRLAGALEREVGADDRAHEALAHQAVYRRADLDRHLGL